MRVKIYTRTGDTGKTSLYGGKRVDKHNLQVVAYGTVDELNSALGVVISHLDTHLLGDFLTTIQSDLFSIGSSLAGSNTDLDVVGKRILLIEKKIDALDKNLVPLKNFILPGGSPEASFAHLARSICRRVEREVIRLSKTLPVDKRIIIYLNRLSDLLFVAARYLNSQKKVRDIIWKTI